jgi:hypothetical protein
MFRVILLTLALAIATPAAAADSHSPDVPDASPFVVVDLPAGTTQPDLADPGVRRALVDQALANRPDGDVVILVRGADGALVRPDAARRAPGGAANTLRFTFDSPDHPWTAEEVAMLQDWLADFLPVAIEVYGPPAFDLTVNVRKDPSSSTAWYAPAWNEIGIRGALYGEAILCHEMMHAFHDDVLLAIGAWEEGMASAATSAVFARLDAYHTFPERHGGQLSLYELLNRPPLGAFRGAFPWNLRTSLRYDMADYAWTKPLLEDPAFLATFNAALYAASATRGGAAWTHADQAELRAMARAARPTVEGLDFDAWYDRQHVLDLGEALGGPVVYVGNVNAGRPVAAQIQVFHRDVGETPVAGERIELLVYDHAGRLIGWSSGSTGVNGAEVLSTFPAPGGEADWGRLRLRVTAYAPSGPVFDELHLHPVTGPGIYGVVVGADDGEVTAVRRSDGLAATTAVTKGAFALAALDDLPGTFDLTYRDPSGRTDAFTITKDRAAYHVTFRVGPPPPPPAWFAPAGTVEGGGEVAIGDVNGDGHADLVIASAPAIRVWAGDGAFGFTLLSTAVTPEDAARGVALGDLDRDGDLDLVVSHSNSGGISRLLGDGNGNFGPPQHYSTSNCCSDRVWLHDLDRNGVPDAVVVNTDDSHVSVLLGDGVGGFTSERRLAVDRFSDYVAVGDFDRDGVPDLVASQDPPALRFFRGDGTGAFVPVADVVVGSMSFVPTALAVGDVDGDGWADVLVGNGNGTTSILHNDRAGGFVREDLAASVGALRALADLNVDGALDLVTSSRPAGLRVLFGTGDGRFVSENVYEAPSGWMGSVLAGNLDADGAPDLVASGLPVALFRNRVAPPPPVNLVTNPSFEEPGWDGWDPYHGSDLDRSAVARTGTYGLRVRGPANLEQFGVNDHPNWVQGFEPGTMVRFRAWVRGEGAPGPARLRVREYVNKVRVGGSNYSNVVQLDEVWQQLAVDYRVRRAGASLDLQVVLDPTVAGAVFHVDDVSIEVAPDDGIREEGGEVTAVTAAGGAGPAFGARIEPNPSRGEAVLAITTTRAGALRAALHDLAGRRVRTLIDAPQVQAGTHAVPVGGGATQRLAPGLYFYRVDAAEGRATGRFAILE